MAEPARAWPLLRDVVRTPTWGGLDVVMPLGDAVEALAALGRLETVDELVDTLEDEGRNGQRWAGAAALRSRALCLLARGDADEAAALGREAAEGFDAEAGRPRLYLATPEPCQLVVIDTAKNEVAAMHPVKAAGGAHPVALDEARHRVYLGCRKAPMVVALDTETGREVGTAPLPEDVDDLHFDAGRKRLYASCGEGFIAVLKVDGDKIEPLEKVPTAKGAKTCLFVPETGRLYLAVPKQEGKDGPEVWVYQAKP